MFATAITNTYLISLKRSLMVIGLLSLVQVFGDAVLMKSNASKVELNAIFSNVNDITELTMQVITLLEDTIEMKEEDNEPAVGSCFEGNIHGDEL